MLFIKKNLFTILGALLGIGLAILLAIIVSLVQPGITSLGLLLYPIIAGSTFLGWVIDLNRNKTPEDGPQCGEL